MRAQVPQTMQVHAIPILNPIHPAPRRFCNVWDSLARVCMPRRLRFDEDAGSDDLTERGRLLLRDELVRLHLVPL